jgi:TIR domain-containing protein/uncharacterized protein DUF3298
MVNEIPSIFLSYASPDRHRVTPFYEDLISKGFNVWMDCQNLKPGQNWQFEIELALTKAAFVVIFISENSYDRRGFCQREIKLALEKMSEKLIDDIYIIPVLLHDEIHLPPELKNIQSIRATDPNCKQSIVSALEHQLDRLDLKRLRMQKREEILWTKRKINESVDGAPGYDVELELIDLSSNRYRNIHELTDHIKGWLVSELFSIRKSWWTSVQGEFFNEQTNKYVRTDSYHAICGEPKICGKVLSVQYTIHWYGAGAAHGNTSFKTYCVVLEPLSRIECPSEMFSDIGQAFSLLQLEVRKHLYQVLTVVSPSAAERDDIYVTDKQGIDQGTADWINFRSFVLDEQGMTFLFAPYEVACYAAGSQSATVPLKILIPLFSDRFRDALGI